MEWVGILSVIRIPDVRNGTTPPDIEKVAWLNHTSPIVPLKDP